MNTGKGPTEQTTGSVDGKQRTIAVIGAWVCIGVAASAAALWFLL
jgi:hypothetical protein